MINFVKCLILLFLCQTCFAETTAIIEWDAPQFRENGQPLFDYEIKGYEIKYLKKGTLQNTEIKINILDTNINYYNIDLENPSSYIWKIAVYDLNNLYSDFVEIADKSVSSTSSSSSASSSGKILPTPTNLKVEKYWLLSCEEISNCLIR